MNFRQINLKLRPNENLISPNFKIHVRDEIFGEELNYNVSNCHYLHQADSLSAAISFCDEERVVRGSSSKEFKVSSVLLLNFLC